MQNESSIDGNLSSPLVSVIVPVRNAGLYLDECIDSIEKQTMSDWELVAINDSSTDNSLEILERRAALDSRISIYQHCGNAGTARNEGMDHAAGKYFIFLDADDFFEPEMLQEAVSRAEKHATDIVMFGGRRYDNRTGELFENFDFLRMHLAPSGVFSRGDVPETLFRITYPGPCTKLFRADFIRQHGLRFQSLTNAEDLSFTLSAVALAERLLAFGGDYLRYRVNTGKSTEDTKKKDPLCFLEALFRLQEILEEKDLWPELKKAFGEQFLSTVRYNLDTVGDYGSLVEIINVLASDRCAGLELYGHEQDWYVTKYGYECSRYIESAIAQLKTQSMEHEQPLGLDASFRCVKPAQLDGSPFASIVVPVFDTEDYLGEALDSLSAQTFNAIEIICVDDGSRDNSLLVALERAENDPRISVYSQRNLGLSRARNAGIEVAAGEYVVFLDSDDLLEDRACELLYAAARGNAPAMIMFNAQAFYEDDALSERYPGYKDYYLRSGEYGGVYKGSDLLCEMVENDDYRPAAWLSAARRDFLRSNEIGFHPGILHEDNAFSYRALVAAQAVVFIDEILYRRRIRQDSIVTRDKTFAHAYGYYACCLDMTEVYFAARKELEGTFASTPPFLVLHCARKDFGSLPEYEKGGLLAMRPADSKAFLKAMDVEQSFDRQKKAAESARRRANDLERKLKKAEAANKRLKNSRSYKIGRFATAPLRLVKRKLAK